MITKESVLYSDINELFLTAQFQLNEMELSIFLEWVYTQIENLLPQLKNRDIKLDYFFRANTEIPVPDLSKQVRFLIKRINLERIKINDFIMLKKIFEIEILKKDYISASKILDDIENKFGFSFWSIQNRIFIIQNNQGLEAQKKYSNDLRKKLSYGIVKYFIYNISVRNEDATSIKNFDDQLDKKSENIEISTIKNYIKFKLRSYTDLSLDQMKEVLFIEQYHSIIDQYETLLEIIQNIFKGENSSYLDELNIEKIYIEDDRIDKIKKYIQSSENLKYTREKRLYKKKLVPNIIDIYLLLYHSLNSTDYSAQMSLLEEICFYLNSVLTRKTDNDISLGKLLKICTNLSGLSITKDLSTFIAILNSHDYLNKKNLISLSLNSPLYGFEESIYFSKCNPNTNLLSNFINDPNFYFDKSHKQLETISLIKKLLQSNISSIEKTIELISNEAIKGYSYTYILPISYSLKDYTIIDYRKVNNKINLFIALHEHYSATKSEKEQRKIATLLKTLLREFFSKLEINPSQLNKDDIENEKFIYFLKYVCSENFIDQLKSITSTKQVLEERINIYLTLKEVDEKNKSKYDDEIQHTAFKLDAEEGQQIVDKTRIYVDEEHFKKWMRTELSELFHRYKDIKKVNIELPIDIDSIVESIKEKTDKVLQLTTEDEVLLYNILKIIKNEFLTNPSFGLDFYLSQRIRHQSFVGLIRGPLEHENLITIKDSISNKYEKNEYLLSKIDNKLNSSKKLNIALMGFSEKFDNILISAKDDYFQILSPEKPKGLFKIDIDLTFFEISKMLINESKTINEFTDYILPLLWNFTEHSLKNARHFIINYLKPNIENYLNELNFSLKKYLDNEHKNNILIKLSSATTEVKNALIISSNWFSHDIDILNDGYKTYNIKEAFDIATSLSLKCLKAFEPDIEYKINIDNFKLSSFSLIFIHDFMFVILDNIYKYSGKRKPKIYIEINFDTEKKLLLLKITSPIKSEFNDYHIKNINKIKNTIKNGDLTSKNKTENGSGLLKLASKIHNKDGGFLSFNILDNSFILDAAFYVKPNTMEV
jgi:hypothetical protein